MLIHFADADAVGDAEAEVVAVGDSQVFTGALDSHIMTLIPDTCSPKELWPD